MTTFKVGDEAVILWYGYGPSATRATRVTVIRKGKRDLTLSDGSRFNAARLERMPSGAWGPAEYLVHPDDPRVAKADDDAARREALDQVYLAYGKWRSSHSNPALTRALAAAATALADHLDAQEVRRENP